MNEKSIDYVPYVVLGLLLIVLAIFAFYIFFVDKGSGATGWWSTETDPVTGKVFSCLTVTPNGKGGVALHCFEQ